MGTKCTVWTPEPMGHNKQQLGWSGRAHQGKGQHRQAAAPFPGAFSQDLSYAWFPLQGVGWGREVGGHSY